MSDTRQQFFEKLYVKVFPSFAAYVARNSGTFEEAKDAFQEALLTYYEKQVDSESVANPPAYLFTMSRNFWLKARKESDSIGPLDDNVVRIADDKETDPSPEKLIDLLKLAGTRCMELLQSFYYERLTMENLANRFGYTSERSATVQKYKCLEKVREVTKEKELTYESFVE